MEDNKYLDSQVAIYHGPRRGGKTLTMSYDKSEDMLAGRKCYTNYPIRFDYTGIDNITRRYESEPLIESELLIIDNPKIKEKYNRASVGWDEGSLSLFSRDFMAARNRVMGLVITLIGKLEMDFGFTCQFLSLLDKNIKIQMDALVFCHDMSFKQKQYKRGTHIGQAFQDISGRFTGEMFEHSQRVYYQVFKGEPFFPIYDTMGTFPILTRRYKMKDVRAGIQSGDMDATAEATAEEAAETGAAIIEHLVRELQTTGNIKIRQPLIYAAAKDRGYRGTSGDMAYTLMKLGARNYQSGGNMWDLTDVGLVTA